MNIGFIGVALIAMCLILLAVFPAKAPQLPEGFFTPIIAFEFIQTPAEVYLLFGHQGTAQRQMMVHTMDLGNRLDFIYMVLYSGFLAAFCLKVSQQTQHRLYIAGAVIAAVVLLGDFLENLQLLGITANLGTGDFLGELERLRLFTWQKWGGLCLVFAVLVPYFIKGRLFSKIIAAWAALTVITGITAFWNRSIINEVFSLFTAVMFVLMITYCFVHKRSWTQASGSTRQCVCFRQDRQ